MISCAWPTAARVEVVSIRVQVVIAWPRRFQAIDLIVPAGTTLADAASASGFDLSGITGHAIHGERADAGAVLRDGDRVELLRPLQADPKDARRRRAAAATKRS